MSEPVDNQHDQPTTVIRGESGHDVRADELLPGRSYRLETGDSGESYFRLLPQSDNDLPRVVILPDVLTEVRRLQRSMKSKQLGGWRPDIALVVSALVTHTLEHEDAKQIVREYVKTHMAKLEDDEDEF